MKCWSECSPIQAIGRKPGSGKLEVSSRAWILFACFEKLIPNLPDGSLTFNMTNWFPIRWKSCARFISAFIGIWRHQLLRRYSVWRQRDHGTRDGILARRSQNSESIKSSRASDRRLGVPRVRRATPIFQVFLSRVERESRTEDTEDRR